MSDELRATDPDTDALPFFGMWADREDMQDSAAWVRKEREKWQRWRGELAGSDALAEHLAEHADEVSKENACPA